MSLSRIPGRKNCLSLSLVAALALSLPVQPAAADSDDGPVRRALLIGVNDYKADGVSDLRGTINDTKKIENVLITRFGFPPAYITILTDSAATRDGILAALRKIVSDAGPDDIVYVHFSGHGSQATDFNGDETEDNLDETLVPHDGRMPGIPDITDDELDAIFAGFKTKEVLIVLDSCHSGTGTRSLSILTRSVPRDERDSLYKPSATRGSVARDVTSVAKLHHILMTGADSFQSALDGPIGGKYYGVFSYSLGEALDAGPGATPAEIYARITEEFRRVQQQEWSGTAMPEPQLEAEEGRLAQPLFPTLARTAAQPTFEVAAGADKTYLEARPGYPGYTTLLAGALLGATPGSFWGIYTPEMSLRGNALAIAKVDRIEGNDAVARLDRVIEVPANGRAVEVAPAAASRIITVDVRASSAIRSELEAAIAARTGGVKFVSSDKFARFILEVEDGEAALYGAAGLIALDRFLWTNAAAAADRLVPALSKSVNAAAITSLTNKASNLALEVSIVAERERGIGTVPSSETANYRILRSGEKRSTQTSLMLEFSADQDVYLTLVVINSQGEADVLFPNGYQKPGFLPDGLIRGGQTVRIPDSLQDSNQAGFHWDYIPPAGDDLIQVFASTDIETARLIREYVGLVSQDTRARSVPATRGLDRSNPDAAVEQIRDQLALRGIGVVAASAPAAEGPAGDPSKQANRVSDWTVKSVRIHVGE